jgi:hypothetical protein
LDLLLFFRPTLNPSYPEASGQGENFVLLPLPCPDDFYRDREGICGWVRVRAIIKLKNGVTPENPVLQKQEFFGFD